MRRCVSLLKYRETGGRNWLDNLKLGYAGTQQGMADLINASGVLGDKIKVTAETVKDVPLDKIFEAIHKIQTEMGVTGTTAEEAATTISGSWSAVQAAWSNLLSGLADDKEMDRLVDNLFETGENLATNVLRIVPRIGRNVLEAADSFLSRWDLWGDIKESFDEGGILGALSTIGGAVWSKLQEWGPIGLDAGSALIANIASGITGNEVSKDSIKTSIETLWTGVSDAASIVWNTVGEMYGKIKTALDEDAEIGTEIGQTIAAVFAAGGTGIDGLLSASGSLFSNIYAAVTGDTEGAEKLKKLLSGAGETAEKAATTAGEFVGGFADTAAYIAAELSKVEQEANQAAEEGKKNQTGGENALDLGNLPTYAKYFNEQVEHYAKGLSGAGWLHTIGGVVSGLFNPAWGLTQIGLGALTPGKVEYTAPPEDQLAKLRGGETTPTYTPEEIAAAVSAIKEQPADYEGTSFTGPGGEQIDPWYLYEGLGDLEEFWGDGAEEVGNAIIEAAEQVTEESRKQQNQGEQGSSSRPNLDEGEDKSSLGEILAGLQGLVTALAALPAEVAAAAAEGCAAGVGNISITGHVSTGNVMLSNGLLVGALAPMLNLALGSTRNSRG